LLPNGKLNGGEIFFRGRNLLSLSEDQLRGVRGRQISLIPQDPALSLNPVIAVGTQISEALRAHLPLTARERRGRVIELLVEVDFEQPEEIYRACPHQLSGGQRQRVVIAQAIACTPRLIIADEPTSKLDNPLRAEIVALLSKIRLQHGTAVLFITHEPALIPGFADRIAVMYAGKVVEIGACDQLLRNPLHPYTEALLRLARPGAPAISRKHLPTIEGEVPDLTVYAAGCIFEPRCAPM
jgi:oligopeptide/dipeptide ABC transporter ATP-binding protein